LFVFSFLSRDKKGEMLFLKKQPFLL